MIVESGARLGAAVAGVVEVAQVFAWRDSRPTVCVYPPTHNLCVPRDLHTCMYVPRDLHSLHQRTQQGVRRHR